MRLVEVQHDTVVVERRGDHCESAEHLMRTESLRERIEVLHAVEKREDRRPGSDGARKRFHGRHEIVRLAAHEDEIVWASNVLGEYMRRGGNVRVAELAPDDEPGLRKLGRAARTDEERHVAIGLQQSRAEVAAERAGTND